jgi:hypothetical protein
MKYLKHINRIHVKILLSIYSISSVHNMKVRCTNRACAMTFEKLSLKILIKDVIRRMLVMHTNINYSYSAHGSSHI